MIHDKNPPDKYSKDAKAVKIAALRHHIAGYENGTLSKDELITIIQKALTPELVKQPIVSDMRLNVSVSFNVKRPIYSGETRTQAIKELGRFADQLVSDRLNGKIADVEFGGAKVLAQIVAEGY